MSGNEPSRTSESGSEIARVDGPEEGLDHAEVERIGEAVAAARAPGTRRAYASAWRGWQRHCVERGRVPMPADPAQLAAYLTALAEAGRSVSTLDRVAAAVSAAHLDAGLADPVDTVGVRRVRAGLRRIVGVAPRHRAYPLDTTNVRRIVAGIDRGTVIGARDAALILTGYAGAMRRSEIIGLDLGDLDFRPRGIITRIRRSKTDQDAAGELVGITRGEHPGTDPVAALLRWVRVAGADTPESPVFVTVHRSGRPTGRRLSGRDVARILARRADAVGLGDLRISPHSLRAGHLTVAAEAGVPALRLARTSRHSSLEVLASYIRPAQVLDDTTSAELGL